MNESFQWKHITVAGTFDHFHTGHRYLLDLAFQKAEKISIGIASEELYKNKTLAQEVQPFDERKEIVTRYVQEQNMSSRVVFFELKDFYGIALEDETLDSIYVTQDTVANAQKINEKRKEKGMKELEIFTAPFLEADDDTVISSTKIRLGVMDTQGHSFSKAFASEPKRTATLLVKDELRSPIGDLIEGKEDDYAVAGKLAVAKLKKDKPAMVIAVGDIVTQSLQQQGVDPDISFIDYKTRRKALDNDAHHAIVKHGPFTNDAGSINSEIALEFVQVVQQVLEKKEHHQIIIEGEEDLLGLPAILLAPLGSVVLYGQFDVGIVYVPVEEEVKRFCDEMLLRFE